MGAPLAMAQRGSAQIVLLDQLSMGLGAVNAIQINGVLVEIQQNVKRVHCLEDAQHAHKYLVCVHRVHIGSKPVGLDVLR